jgi:hypothetical protein
MKKTIILSLLAVALLSCCAKKGANGASGEDGRDGTVSENTSRPATQGTFEVLKQHGYGGRESASNVVVTSQQQLDELYKELNLGEAPKVDFSERNVVALFMGQKSSGGHSIGIKEVNVAGNTATVQIVTASPQGNATMALTQPYCIASITKTDKVVFR